MYNKLKTQTHFVSGGSRTLWGIARFVKVELAVYHWCALLARDSQPGSPWNIPANGALVKLQKFQQTGSGFLNAQEKHIRTESYPDLSSCSTGVWNSLRRKWYKQTDETLCIIIIIIIILIWALFCVWLAPYNTMLYNFAVRRPRCFLVARAVPETRIIIIILRCRLSARTPSWIPGWKIMV